MDSIHAKCAGHLITDGGVVLVCGKSLYHSNPECYDPSEDRSFTAEHRRKAPKPVAKPKRR